jgi:pyridoxal phosphate enzyme (YggS family)
MTHDIPSSFDSIRRRINKAERSCGRVEGEVTLVAVSKMQEQSALEAALAYGHRVFGENRVQEAKTHWDEIRAGGAYPDLQLHLIGPLQTNKVKEAIALFDVIETLDREKLATALKDEMEKQGRNLPCFIQVNTGEEEQKAGITPRDLEDFYEFCTKECRLTITGLMCIPPVEDAAGLHFALLKKYAAIFNLKNLSMGMSADFEKAIPIGATHVRVGSALFGVRQ